MLLTSDEIRKRLADRRLTAVAEETGINYNRLWRLVRNRQEASEEDLTRLTDYLVRSVP